MSWIQVCLSGMCAIVGGFVGGWTVAFRLGRWRQWVEDRLMETEKRLSEGDPHVESVPIIKAQIDLVLDEIREIKTVMRDERSRFVSHQECDRRHRDAVKG